MSDDLIARLLDRANAKSLTEIRADSRALCSDAAKEIRWLRAALAGDDDADATIERLTRERDEAQEAFLRVCKTLGIQAGRCAYLDAEAALERTRAAAIEEAAPLRMALEEIVAGAPTEKPEDSGYIGNEDDAETEGWNKARYWAAEIARRALAAAPEAED